VASAIQCPYCINAYTRTGLENGSSLEPMTEALQVAAAIRGGATLVDGIQIKTVAEKLSNVMPWALGDAAELRGIAVDYPARTKRTAALWEIRIR
jgi:AhpD family alkylhydroperoxidase